ncbi:MurR/RpiR family transcriptional regulator [Nonomuraea antimicrobica]
MENDAITARLGAVYAELPAGERAVVRVLLDDYPFAALGSLRALAERAGVSPPTASRLFDRLGFAGFAAFQAAVRDGERDRSRLLEYVSAPGSTASSPGASAGEEVSRAAEELRTGLDGALAVVSGQLGAQVAALLSEAGSVWALGGPLSELAAEYLVRQLASLRPGAHRVPGPAAARARTVLDLGASDVVVAYDFRRYSPPPNVSSGPRTAGAPAWCSSPTPGAHRSPPWPRCWSACRVRPRGRSRRSRTRSP